MTCYRVGILLNDPRIPALLVSHRRPAFYLRVREEGDVQAGDEIAKVASGPEQMAVAEVDRLLYLPGHPRQRGTRKEGARLAVENARRDVAAFEIESFERLVAELLAPSMQAQARLAAACDELEQALEAWSAVRFDWARITVMAGIPADEMPTSTRRRYRPRCPTRWRSPRRGRWSAVGANW